MSFFLNFVCMVICNSEINHVNFISSGEFYYWVQSVLHHLAPLLKNSGCAHARLHQRMAAQSTSGNFETNLIYWLYSVLIHGISAFRELSSGSNLKWLYRYSYAWEKLKNVEPLSSSWNTYSELWGNKMVLESRNFQKAHLSAYYINPDGDTCQILAT